MNWFITNHTVRDFPVRILNVETNGVMLQRVLNGQPESLMDFMAKEMVEEYEAEQKQLIAAGATQELIKKQDEYIKLLEDWDSSIVGFLMAHRIICPDNMVKKGKKLREKIKELKNKLL